MHLPSLLEHRPGDAPHLFELDTATVAIGADGKIARFTEPGLITSLHPVALEPDCLVLWHIAWRRQTNGPDPANDAVTAGIDWLNANKMILARRPIASVTSASVASGRQTATRLLGPLGSLRADVEAPLDARYARPWIEIFGTGHATDIEICACLEVPLRSQSTSEIDAPGVLFPEDFQWPEPVIPPIPITPTAQDALTPGLYQPDPATLIPRDWVAHAPVDRMIFMSQGGRDTNSGLALTDPVRSIEKALEIAAEAPDQLFSIQCLPGRYETDGHLDVPDTITEIAGLQGQRSVVFTPTPGNATRNVFRLGSGGMLRNISGVGWQVDAFETPSEGFLASFRPGAVIARALYLEHCVMYRAQPPGLIPPPLDPENGNPQVGNGPGLVLADAAVASAYSPFAQVMVEASTNSAPNGLGIVARGNTYVNAINMVSLWGHIHYKAEAGALLALTNCETQMGDYTMWSQGARAVLKVPASSGPLVADAAAAQILTDNTDTILNAMWARVVADGFGGLADEALSRRDAGLLVKALAYDLSAGQQEATEIFVTGLFVDGRFISLLGLPAFVSGWEGMRTGISGLIGGDALAMVNGLLDLIITVTAAPRFTTVASEINANPVKISVPFGGVNRRAFFRKPRDARQTIVERALGKVVFAGADDSGRQYLIGGAIVNANTGVLEGPPINRTVTPLAMRTALTFGNR